MSRMFISIFAPYLQSFLSLKRTLGYKYNGSSYILYSIDQYAKAKNINFLGLNKELSIEWCARRPNEAERTWYGRVIVLREFASYLKDNGIDAYIPVRPKHPNDSFVPHIFTHDEINRLFNSADKLRLEKQEMRSAIFSIPILLRFLYGTGLRLNEALSLKDGDVNLQNGTVLAKNNKSGKDRIIPISETLVKSCENYLHYRNILKMNGIKNNYFFVSINGNKLYQTIVYRWYRVCMENANIPFYGGYRGPRVHDLRHTFAVHSMASMADSGVYLYVSLPILSTYMGHDSLKSTEYYLRLTAEMYPSVINNLEDTYLEIFPNL